MWVVLWHGLFGSFFFPLSVNLFNNRMEAIPVELLQLPNVEEYVLFLYVCYLLYLSSLYTKAGTEPQPNHRGTPVVDTDDTVEGVSVSF
jgi:hypothetical protein